MLDLTISSTVEYHNLSLRRCNVSFTQTPTNPWQFSLDTESTIPFTAIKLTILKLVKLRTYLWFLTRILILLLMKFINFSQAFASGEYRGISNNFNFWCFTKSLISLVLWKKLNYLRRRWAYSNQLLGLS